MRHTVRHTIAYTSEKTDFFTVCAWMFEISHIVEFGRLYIIIYLKMIK